MSEAQPQPQAQPRPASPSASSARRVALDALDAVLSRRQPAEEAIEVHPGFPELAPRDRAFARHMVATTLRRLGQIDAVIDAALDRSLTPRAAGARNILRLGAVQILFLGTPAHAAVDTTVELAGGPMSRYRPLVNAVLRRIVGEGPALVARQDAARLNVPDWLWTSWRQAYGDDLARAIADMHLTEPPLDLTVKSDPEGWARRIGGEVLPTGSVRRRTAAGPIAELPGYGVGAWWVQDAAAALPARLLGDVRGRAVLDLCAAPGGKTAQLAAAGARVTAVDRTAMRLARLRSNLDRLALTADLVAADAGSWRPPEPAERIILDAPCSATGTIRRHPDVQRLKSPADVQRLATTQDRLLRAAASMLAPGGILVYCVCSLEPEEGVQRVAAILRDDPALHRVPIAADEVAGLVELVTVEGDLRTLPCHLAEFGGLDGFYASRLVRR